VSDLSTNAPVAGGTDQATAASRTLFPVLTGKMQSDRAQLDKLHTALEQTDSLKDEFAGLEKLGPNVGPDDVLEAAGRGVEGGLDPMAMASILSDMPQAGPAIQSWLQQHSQNLAKTEQQIQQQAAVTAHSLGVSAMKVIAAHTLRHHGLNVVAARGGGGGGGGGVTAGAAPTSAAPPTSLPPSPLGDQ